MSGPKAACYVGSPDQCSGNPHSLAACNLSNASQVDGTKAARGVQLPKECNGKMSRMGLMWDRALATPMLSTPGVEETHGLLIVALLDGSVCAVSHRGQLAAAPDIKQLLPQPEMLSGIGPFVMEAMCPTPACLLWVCWAVAVMGCLSKLL